jgi:hypothetical protein
VSSVTFSPLPPSEYPGMGPIVGKKWRIDELIVRLVEQ